MAFLYNIAADRELREGDAVRVSTGPRAGRECKVVGFDVLSERPVVVQYETEAGLLRESLAANDIEIRGYVKAPESLEPLPEIRMLLRDSKTQSISTCGAILCIRLDDCVLSFVPKGENSTLRQIYEGSAHNTFEDKVSDLLQHSFVTRLPHLVRSP
jgi:hypothetical protein